MPKLTYMPMNANFDVIFVGAGPASLASAIHLKNITRGHPKLDGISIAIIEKSQGLGDHILSGAVLDGYAIKKFIPDFEKRDIPLNSKVSSEWLYFLTKKHGIKSPFVPPPLSNKGKYMASLSDIVRWMGGIAESEGIEIYTGETADEVIMNKDTAVGVRIKEKRRMKDGSEAENYVPSMNIGAKILVLGEGSRGYLTKRLIEEKGLNDKRIPQGYAIGVKELWQIDESKSRSGTLINVMGYPLPMDTFGGGFIYHIKKGIIAIGMVVGLDYKHAALNPFEVLQKLKLHPSISPLFDGGKLISYGAKTICEGGIYAMPKTYGNGFLIIGEAAGILDSMRLKGIDPAIESGMIAAETIRNALAMNDVSEKMLSSYEPKLKQSRIGRDMYRARNFHQGFHHGIALGAVHASLQFISGGRGIIDRFDVKEDRKCTLKIDDDKTILEGYSPDGIKSFDRLTCVFASGTRHEEDQPSHIRILDESICNGVCKEEYGNPCLSFCPAGVFEMVNDKDGKKKISLNPSNCLHCKTCDIKDPYDIVEWTSPDACGGPNYRGM